MNTIDLVVVGLGVLLLLGAGFAASRRTKNRNTEEFILGGRRLPWWLAGTAMVAGSSNADSPLHQSGKIRRDGLAGAWFYWSQIIPQIWHSIVFSRLWRRAEIQTVVEFYEIRYTGRAQVAGRVWSMFFASFVEGTIVLALGMLAMIRISTVLLGLHEPVAVMGISVSPEVLLAVVGVGLAMTYSTVAGLLGVVAGDVVEFLVATLCSYVLMFRVYREVGYSEGLAAGLARLDLGHMLSLTPSLGVAALVFFVVQPVAMAAGTNGINQRYMALRDEKEAMLAGVWRIVNHFIVRAWPWYLCGLISLVLLPDTALPRESVYPQLIADYLPTGLRGLMFAGFLVAFMSSVSSSMHSAGSVFVNDFYRPYVRPAASPVHYVWVVRVTMIVLAGVGAVIALHAESVLGLLQFLMQMIAATGAVMLLRWFWWRVNGWADFAAQLLALPVTVFFAQAGAWFGPRWDLVARLSSIWGGSPDQRYAATLLLTVGTTTLGWLLVMAVTKPEPMPKLEAFYRRVRPYGWWGPVARRCPDVVVTDRAGYDLKLYGMGLGLSFGLLFGVGAIFLGHVWTGATLVALALGLGGRLVRAINRSVQ